MNLPAKEKIAVRQKKYIEENKEKVAAQKKRWNDANKEKRGQIRRDWKYGKGANEIYLRMLKEQDGKCACCGKKQKNNLCVDHDRTTEKPCLIRGLLCFECNIGIGQLGDTEAGVDRAIRYLENVS